MKKIKQFNEWLDRAIYKDIVTDNVTKPLSRFGGSLGITMLLGIVGALGIILLVIPAFLTAVIMTLYNRFHKPEGVLKTAERYCEECLLIEGELKFDTDMGVGSNIHVFIHRLFELNGRCNTIHAKTRYIQCTKGRRRSLGDIYCLCKHYFPGCKPLDVLRELIKLVEEGSIGGSRCNTINKYVFYTENTRYSDGPTEYGVKEGGHYITFGEVKHAIKESK